MLTGKQKSYLRGLANGLQPVMQIGKNGLNENFIDTLNDALEAHELVKISVLQSCLEDKKTLVNQIEVEARCEPVQVIGNQLIFYRYSHKENKKDKIELPK